MNKKIRLIYLLFLSMILAGCSGKKDETISRSNFYFDTIITITLYGADDDSAIDACFSLASRYEKLFSNTVKESDVSRINENAGKFVTVDPETLSLIWTGIRYGQMSGGKFDITLGNLSGLWNFSEIAKNIKNDDNTTDISVLPSESAVKSAVSHIDYRKIEIDEKNSAVRLTDNESQLDLGGIAKGYIADKMKESLIKNGISSAIINLGGNVLTVGGHPDGSPFSIGIQKPFAANGKTLGLLKIKDKTVVSSGIYERYYRVNGKLYHHILDVSTGFPYENGLYEVTIICDKSVDADALSTTCFALGLEDGMALIESLPDTEAVFVDADENLHFSSGVGEKKEIVFDSTN